MGLDAPGVRTRLNEIASGPPSVSATPRAGAPRVGLSLMPSDDWWAANEPLFLQEAVDAVEWSVDFGWGPEGVPPWLDALLHRFGEGGRLYAHGVELSPMSARWTDDHEAWLDALEGSVRSYRFVHLTEHYGFITASDFVRGTPLPLPPSSAALDLACRRIQTIRERSGLAVGIENLAFAFSARDVEAQATFVSRLVRDADAFVLLDVHNLYCQAHNFGINALALAQAYPLERVREIHVSGGSWSTSAIDPTAGRFRRDSHDDRTPNEVLALVESLVDSCPALEVVILERSDRSLFGRDEAQRHREDFTRLRSLVNRCCCPTFGGTGRGRSAPQRLASLPPPAPVELVRDDEATLDAYQSELLETLERAQGSAEARAELLGMGRIAAYRDYVRTFEPRALEVGSDLVKQWGARLEPDDTMRAAVFSAPGSPLLLRSLPRIAPGPGQVLLRIAAVGLCGTDLHAYRGRFPVPTPIVLGHEAVGVVDEVGAGVTELRRGERVGVSWIQAGCGDCDACDRGIEARCPSPRTWIENGGGLSEWMVAEASGCTRLPDGLPFEEAAPLFCAGHVAMSGLRRAKPVRGERIAVVGLGGLGHLAVQIAAAMGHETVVVSSSVDKLEDARETFGAHHVVLVEHDDVGAALERIGGADIVLATTSSIAHASSSISGLRVGGRLVLMGLGEGSFPLDPIDLVQREASIIGSIQGPRTDLEDLLQLAAQGSVRARVETFPLVMAQRAMQRLVDGRVRYRAVVTLGG